MDTLDSYFQKYFDALKKQNVVDNDDDNLSTKEKYGRLYAFYGIENGNERRAEIVKKRSCDPDDDSNNGIAGAFDNTNDDVLEVVVPIEKISNEGEISKLLEKSANVISAIVENVRKGKDGAGGTDLEESIGESNLVFSDKNPAIKTVIMVCENENDDSRRNALVQFANNYRNKNFSAEIIFPQDLLEICATADDSLSGVPEATLFVDGRSALEFSANECRAIVVNLRASSLRKLYEEYKHRGLFDQNLRYYIRKKDVDSPIEETIRDKHEIFWVLNNGITITCDDFRFASPQKTELDIKNFSIVNGCQTASILGSKFSENAFDGDNDFFILCKIICPKTQDEEEKTDFIAKIAEAANRQKPIKEKDLIANRPEQRKLKKMLKDNNIFYELKSGEKMPNEKDKPWLCVKSVELGQLLLSALGQLPGAARTSPAETIFGEKHYKDIFGRTHKLPVYRDLLLLNDFVKEWIDHELIREDKEKEKTKRIPLLKNGRLGIVATFAAFAKLVSHPEIRPPAREDPVKVRQSMVAWDDMENGFFANRDTQHREKLQRECFAVFRYLMDACILEAYTRANNEDDVAPSNFFKTKKFHEAILALLNQSISDIFQKGFDKIFTQHGLDLNPVSSVERFEEALFRMRWKLKKGKKTKRKANELWLTNEQIKKIAENGDEILDKKNTMQLSDIGLDADQREFWEEHLKKALKKAL